MVRDDATVVRKRGKDPRVGGAPRDRVDRVLVLVVGANQLVAVLERVGRAVLRRAKGDGRARMADRTR